MRSHVLSFSRWVSGESRVCDVLAAVSLCCVCLGVSQVTHMVLYCFKCKHGCLLVFETNKAYVRVAKGDTETHDRRVNLATEV